MASSSRQHHELRGLALLYSERPVSIRGQSEGSPFAEPYSIGAIGSPEIDREVPTDRLAPLVEERCAAVSREIGHRGVIKP